MRVGHLFVMLLFLWALLESERPLNNISLTSRHLTSWCNQGAFFPSRNVTLGGKNRSFLDGVSVPLEFLDSLYCVHFNNSYGVGSNEPLCLLNSDTGIKLFLSHSLMWICKTKIRTSFINQGQVNKGALYASLLLMLLHLGHLNNETLSITQGISQSIVTTHKGTKQLLSGPLNCGKYLSSESCPFTPFRVIVINEDSLIMFIGTIHANN